MSPRVPAAIPTPHSAAPARSSSHDRKATIGVREVLAVTACGAVFTTLGLWQVETVFRARDYRMASSILQEKVQTAKDQGRDLNAKVGKLQTRESLRQAALTAYGMIEPEPAQVSRIKISKDSADRWAAAQKQADEQIAASMRAYAAQDTAKREAKK